jgi:hypothetical protein
MFDLPDLPDLEPKDNSVLKPIGTCRGVIASVKTTTDGGIQITVGIAGNETELAKTLMDIKALTKCVFVSFVSED